MLLAGLDPVGATPPSQNEEFLRGTADVVELHDVLGTPLDAGEVVLALHPSWGDQAVVDALRVVRSSRETLDLVILPVDLPPLALMTAAGLLARLVAQEGAAHSVVILDRLLECVRTVAWLETVTRLAHVEVPMRLHTRSLLPGSAFAVSLSAQQASVAAADRRDPQLALPPHNGDWEAVLARGERGDVATVERALTSAGWPKPQTVPASPAAVDWWGTDRYVEVVLYPSAAACRALVAELPTLHNCRWCSRATPTEPCVFCGHLSPKETFS